jgi:hypothetical protein
MAESKLAMKIDEVDNKVVVHLTTAPTQRHRLAWEGACDYFGTLEVSVNP